MKNSWQKKSRGDNSFQSKRQLVLEVSARAFNQRGFYKTSLDDIAAELNVTKAALYYYFKNKDEILHECHTMAISQLIDSPAGEKYEELSCSWEKVEVFIRRYVPMITQSFGRCLVMVGSLPLGNKNRKKCQAGRREINNMLVTWIEEGINVGTFKQSDPKITAAFIFGALNWIAQWFDEDGSSPIEQVTEDAVAFVREALCVQ